MIEKKIHLSCTIDGHITFHPQTQSIFTYLMTYYPTQTTVQNNTIKFRPITTLRELINNFNKKHSGERIEPVKNIGHLFEKEQNVDKIVDLHKLTDVQAFGVREAVKNKRYFFCGGSGTGKRMQAVCAALNCDGPILVVTSPQTFDLWKYAFEYFGSKIENRCGFKREFVELFVGNSNEREAVVNSYNIDNNQLTNESNPCLLKNVIISHRTLVKHFKSFKKYKCMLVDEIESLMISQSYLKHALDFLIKKVDCLFFLSRTFLNNYRTAFQYLFIDGVPFVEKRDDCGCKNCGIEEKVVEIDSVMILDIDKIREKYDLNRFDKNKQIKADFSYFKEEENKDIDSITIKQYLYAICNREVYTLPELCRRYKLYPEEIDRLIFKTSNLLYLNDNFTKEEINGSYNMLRLDENYKNINTNNSFNQEKNINYDGNCIDNKAIRRFVYVGKKGTKNDKLRRQELFNQVKFAERIKQKSIFIFKSRKMFKYIFKKTKESGIELFDNQTHYCKFMFYKNLEVDRKFEFFECCYLLEFNSSTNVNKIENILIENGIKNIKYIFTFDDIEFIKNAGLKWGCINK